MGTGRLIFASPRKYIQGAGTLKKIGKFVSPFGETALLIADDTVWQSCKDDFTESFENYKLKFHHQVFHGESSAQEIDRLAKVARAQATDYVIGLGGGKTLDTAKGVANELRQPVAILPSVASTDAPCSALSVIYTPDGSFESYRFYNSNPDLVLIDTAVCVRAPSRMFASGMGDALATNVEAFSVLQGHANSMLGGRPSISGMAIASACERTIFKHGYAALLAAEQHVVTPAVEAVVEANTLMSGLGFENGGLSAAHAIHDGFTALQGDVHLLMHGEKVAFGTLVQLVLQFTPLEDFARFVRFYRKVGLPTTLEDMHLGNASRDDIMKVAELACSKRDTLHNLDVRIQPIHVRDAIFAADKLSKSVE